MLLFLGQLAQVSLVLQDLSCLIYILFIDPASVNLSIIIEFNQPRWNKRDESESKCFSRHSYILLGIEFVKCLQLDIINQRLTNVINKKLLETSTSPKDKRRFIDPGNNLSEAKI